MAVELAEDVFVQAMTADGLLVVDGRAGDVVDGGPLEKWLVDSGKAAEAKPLRRKRKTE